MRLTKFGRVLLLFWIALLITTPAPAREPQVFEVEEARFQLSDSLLLLEARIHIELPAYIEVAVDQGFAVPVSFEVEIMEDRKYWLDRKLVSLKQQYLLHFLPMLDAYVVSDVNQGSRSYFDTREEAVNSLQYIVDYPMFDIGNISTELTVYARMRFGVDSDELPLPLKSSSLWANDWDVHSEWFSWEIDRAGQ